MGVDIIFQILIFLMSVVVHEVAHGYAAYLLGDPTAKNAGRLTVNPIKHLDMFGSIVLPAILILTKAGFIFGWAKPVPYNPYNLRSARWGELIVALAGPASNILLALVFAVFIRVAGSMAFISPDIISISASIVFINLLLAIFNLVPIPPLDGSKILFGLFPYGTQGIRNVLEAYGFIFVLLFIFFLWPIVYPLVLLSFSLFTGIGL